MNTRRYKNGFLTLLLAVFVLVCLLEAAKIADGPRSLGKPTQISVTAMGSSNNDLLPHRNFNSSMDIFPIVSFFNEHLILNQKLGSYLCGIPLRESSTFLKVSFYKDSEYLETFGIGHYGRDKVFIKYLTYGSSTVVCIPKEELRKLLNLTGIKEEEYHAARAIQFGRKY